MPAPQITKAAAQTALNIVAQYGSVARASAATGIPKSTLHKQAYIIGRGRYKLVATGKHAALPGLDTDKIAKLHRAVRSAKGIQRYVITAAQNATPVNAPFLASLLGFCKHNGAKLLVVPYRYHNPTSLWSKTAKDNDWWAPELAPYMYDRRARLNKNLVLLGDIKTQPTAMNPLEGFESITGPRSAIIAHPKLALQTVATPQTMLPKILTSTGAVTKRNYTPSKAGKKGEFHHTFGAAFVEVKGARFHLRQINAVADGSFMDLRWQYNGDERTDTGGTAALVLGDEHEEFMDPKVKHATFGEKGLVQSLRPEYIVSHDIHDFYSRNHHHQGEAFIDYAKHHAGADNVKATLEQTFRYAAETTPSFAKRLFIASNHPDALAKWVKRADWRADPRNAEFLLETALVMLRASKMTPTGAKTLDPFAYWGQKNLSDATRYIFLKADESFIIAGIEVGSHGHYGPNGARGTIKGFSRIGVKSVTGHGHSPGINEGAYRTGVSARLRLEYVHGPSSWLQTHCLIYKNGKRSLLNIIDGEWHA